MTITELKHHLDLLLADAGADLDVLVDGYGSFQVSWTRQELHITTLPAECFFCGGDPEDTLGVPREERCCERCAAKNEECCPGCGAAPGQGLTDGCNDDGGCGFWRTEFPNES